jgi:CheY-like chemotaxis protein
MSDAIVLPETGAAEARRTPTVYFIDDSATMREVIKIAFRRENINVVTCADAASALAQFEENPPDMVITDVIMPDQDGYSVCSQVKQNPQFAKTPVILMSGVVNKSVADRAVAVQADELVRKPFQPQELISRVKNLIGHGAPALQHPSERPIAVPSLSSLFAAPRRHALCRHKRRCMPHRQLQNHVLRTMFGHGRWQRRSCNKGMPPLHNHRRLLRTLLPVRPEPPRIFRSCAWKSRGWRFS